MTVPAVGSLAASDAACRPTGPERLSPHLKRILRTLRAADDRLVTATGVGEGSAGAAEWLLDNRHVIHAAQLQVVEGLPATFLRELPRPTEGPDAGLPRAWRLAHLLVRQAGAFLDLGETAVCVEQYQQSAPLTLGELWAFPNLLRAVVLEELATCAAAVAGLPAPKFTGPPSADQPLETRIAGCITTLRRIAAHDWNIFVERLSVVEAVLIRDPADAHARGDFATRDRYRKAVEQVARWAGAGEVAVAEEALALCQAQAPGTRRRHIGYWLVDDGRVELEARLRAAPPLGVRLRRQVQRHATIWYLGGIAMVALGLLGLAVAYLSVAGGTLLQALVLLVAAVIPAVAVAVPVVNWLVTHTFPPRILARLDFEDQVPDTERTVVAVPTLLTRAADVADLLLQLEINYQGNGDPAITFALVTDCRDADQETLSEDAALVDAAVRGINALNRRYGRDGHQPFAFFHRGRRWNPAEACWMGWERKRGKLFELNHLLLGGAPGAGESQGDATDPAALTLRAGSAEVLTNIRHVITLDADTALPHDAAAGLIGTMAHPLNEPEFDAAGRVIAGYTVLQPRLDVAVRSAGETPFARLFEGDTGVDLYTHAVSDAYHDLFGEGIYAGKGIYQVAAFERSLAGRIPENTLLSHDLFEGIHGRAGFVSDIELFEDYPSHVLTYTRRLHRWVRGDWQLLPWLMGRAGSALSAIDRWKVLDNLRRSLTPPAMVLLLFAGWLVLPGGPWFWTAIAILTLAVPILLGAATSVNRLAAGGAWRPTVAHAVRGAGMDLLRWLLGLLFLAYEAATVTEAVGRTLYRVFRSRRHLLEWQSAALTARTVAAGDSAAYVWRRMIASPVVAVVGAVAVAIWAPGSAPAAAPLLVAWFVAPQIGFLLSQPRRRAEPRISGEERARLRRLARRTWHYFEQVLGPEDSWLAPDNVQMVPVDTVARRTSPTNIGMGLVSTLAAWDLGYLGLRSVTGTLRLSMTGLMSLDRFRGHCYNWYDTRTREVLAPRYVSAVDSGNLAASLMVVRAACLAAPGQPVTSRLLWLGLADTVGIFREELYRAPTRPTGEAWTRLEAVVHAISGELARAPETPAAQWRHLQRLRQVRLSELGARLADCMVPSGERLEARHAQELHHWYERIHYQADRAAAEFETLAPWLALAAEPPADITAPDVPEALRTVWELLARQLDRLPALGAVPRFRDDVRVLMASFAGALRAAPIAAVRREEALAWLDRLALALEGGVSAAAATTTDLHDLARDAGALVDGMDFRFLYDRQRRLFHIGYDVDAARLDSGYYDLLASEARVASLVAIAKRDVPERHWLHLGRPFGRGGVLLSWAGTMFEYLMPGLFLRYPDESLLTRGSRVAVRHQRRFAQRHGIPWGISESAYHQLSPDGHYQYRAFGVPGLGLKRELGDRLVVSPYASLLALPLEPHAVAENVARLEKLGAMGRLGLYEAVDFGAPRAGGQGRPALVKSWMSHHQGMILTAIANHFTGSRMVRRFHADPRVASVDYLLHEQVPRHVTIHRPAVRPVRFIAPRRPRYEGWSVPPLSAAPQLHMVSNGRHSVLVTAAGGGGSRWRGYALSRWRAEAGVDQWGHWLYLQDTATDALWSLGRQPVWDAPIDTSVLFTPDGAEFRTRAHGIAARAVLTVPPEDDVEIRRVTLTNESATRRTIALTGFFEVALARPADDLRHQAFTKLFVESEILDDRHTLLFRRRPGGPDPDPLWLGHAVVLPSDHAVACSFDTDRAAFLGPGGTARRPAALTAGGPLPGTAGATLDPAAAIRSLIVLDPEQEVTVALVTAAAASREVLLARLADFGSWSRIDRAFEEAAVHAERDLSVQGMTLADVRTAQRLLSVIIVPDARLRPPPHALLGERSAQPGLWRFGISGDLPIVVVRADGHEPAASAGVEAAVRAHAHLHRRGCRTDLVVLDDASSGYQQPFFERLDQVIEAAGGAAWRDRPAGVFLVRGSDLSPADRRLLEGSARAVLDGARPLDEQLAVLVDQPTRLPPFDPVRAVESWPKVTASSTEGLQFANGLGGFSADGREYVLHLDDARRLPRAWVHVVANPQFGFVISATGGGFTWAMNSAERRLTPWRNDPVSDAPGELLYLRDEESGVVWQPTPAHEARFGAGYALFEHHAHGLRQTLRLFTPPDDAVKIVELTLRNDSDRLRRITATYYAEWVLGTSRHRSTVHLVPEYEEATQTLLIRNPFDPVFSGRVAFLTADRPAHGVTADRVEFIGEAGDRAHPAALGRIGPSGNVRPGGDACGALQVYVQLEPGEAQTIRFVLGDGDDRAGAQALAQRYMDPATCAEAWRATEAHWDGLLGAIQVQTPDAALDLMLNRWLLYQAVACRVWARSALHQSGGAFGFRDQLQDLMALAAIRPELTRSHLLECARHQFEDGDVLHWWHPGSDGGVRTRCSDDLVWLAYATAHYVAVTGDVAVLDEQVPFLSAPPLGPEEGDRYSRFDTAPLPASLYEHCLRALDHASATSAQGLPLIRGGDWNDGMNRVGEEGRGESVWLAWFLADTQRAFAPLCQNRGDPRATTLLERAAALANAVERAGWDGAWYRRGSYDDGAPLGSAQSDECRIDAIAQSWGVISGLAATERAAQAMRSVHQYLADEELELLRLFIPPFDAGAKDPGYIKAYPPGVRENGGQYTHAALWTAWATGMQGDGDRLGRYLTWLNPVRRTATPEGVARYRGEPYVVAADVSTALLHQGAAGWTWYTGSASWMHRLGIEILLGMKRLDGHLHLDPCIPAGWPGFQARWKEGAAVYLIRVENPRGVCRGVERITLDGQELGGEGVPLVDDGREHEVVVVLGG